MEAEAVVHLDTHVVAWLWAGDRKRLRAVEARLESSVLTISPIVELELQYLFEIGRTTEPGSRVVGDLVDRIGLRLATTPLSAVVARAGTLAWTRDPFDRLIVGTAQAEAVPLLTRDRTIQRHFPSAEWTARR